MQANFNLLLMFLTYHNFQGCVDVSYKTLCEEENDLYFEMEMYIPEEHAVAAIKKWNDWQAMVAPTWTNEGTKTINCYSLHSFLLIYITEDLA